MTNGGCALISLTSTKPAQRTISRYQELTLWWMMQPTVKCFPYWIVSWVIIKSGSRKRMRRKQLSSHLLGPLNCRNHILTFRHKNKVHRARLEFHKQGFPATNNVPEYEAMALRKMKALGPAGLYCEI